MNSIPFYPGQVRATALRLRAGAFPAVALIGLVAYLYGPVLKYLGITWWQDPNYSHGLIVPIFAAYVLWRRRAACLEVVPKPSNAGLGLMCVAIVMLIAGTLGAELFVSRVSLLVLLAGLTVFFLGWKMLATVSFPLGYLLFMIPLPGIIFYQVTLPLQLLASRIAEVSLDLLQVPALREGNLLVLPNTTLEVADACSGIRSLFALLALAVGYGYLAEKSVWKRVILAGLMIPLAVATNGLRLTVTGVLTFAFGPKMAGGAFHAFSGCLAFILAAASMLAVHRCFNFFGRSRDGGQH